jgi:hypothetical protein
MCKTLTIITANPALQIHRVPHLTMHASPTACVYTSRKMTGKGELSAPVGYTAVQIRHPLLLFPFSRMNFNFDQDLHWGITS